MTEAAIVARVREALKAVADPCSIAAGVPVSIEDMGIIRDIRIDQRGVVVSLRPTSPYCFQLDLISAKIVEKGADATDRAILVDVEPIDDWEPEMMAPDARARLRAVRPGKSLAQ